MTDTEHMSAVAPAEQELPRRVEASSPQTGAPASVSLADYLMQKDVHPVLLVGTGATGKTTLLQSLIYFLRRNGGSVDVRLGERVFPPNYLQGDERHENAVRFFNQGLLMFGDNVPATPTQAPYPFFVPIDLLVTEAQGIQIYKFAFYEGTGEWFGKESDESYKFKTFQPEFAEILRNFTNPLSIIFLAPTVDDIGPKQTLNYAHDCLVNAITEFHSHRIDANRDHALLLLTKWDRLYKPSDVHGHFSDVDSDVALSVMKKWKSFIWPKFASVKLDGPRAKALMPYSACWMDEANKTIVSTSDRYQHIFAKYNRTIGNWLYMNIVDSKRDHRLFHRLYLFEDVLRVHKQPDNWWWKLTKAVLRA
jgi:hypothetical protein